MSGCQGWTARSYALSVNVASGKRRKRAMNKREKTWIVLEVETGLIDGWYFGTENIDRDALRKMWSKKRPGYTHVIADIAIGDLCRITDSMALNRAVKMEEIFNNG